MGTRVKRSATPPGPYNVSQKRQSDTEPLRLRPPKAGDRSSRCNGTPGGIPGSAGVSGNPKPGPHIRHSELPANGIGPAGGPSSITNRNRSMEAGFVEPRAGATVARLPSTTPDLRLEEWDGGNPDVPRPPETLGVLYPAPRDRWQEQPHRLHHEHWLWNQSARPFNVRLVNIRLNGRLLHSVRQWKRPSLARGAALRRFFLGGSRPARTAPPVRPSAQPFSPPVCSTAGAHINQSGPSGCRQALHQYQTNGDAHEATRAGIARPAGGRAWAGSAPAPLSSGYRASIRRPKPPGRLNNGPPEHPQTPEGDDS